MHFWGEIDIDQADFALRARPSVVYWTLVRLRWLNHFTYFNSLHNYGLMRTKLTRSVASRVKMLSKKTTPDSANAKVHLELENTIKDWVGDRFRLFNAKTVELTGLDLGGFGYQL